MNNKTLLNLVELVLMVLVFSLASALCLRAFVYADTVSLENEQVSGAMREARSAAEILKSVKGDADKACALRGKLTEPDTWTVLYDESWEITENEEETAYTLTAHLSREGLLGSARIEVSGKDGTSLFTLTGSWQEDPV